MNIREYLDNPMGKGSSAMTNKSVVLASLRDEFNRLKLNKKITHKIYKFTPKEYVIHITLPTVTDRGNTYDVVIQFYTEDKSAIKATSMLEYDVRFFCNAPSFVFTYANAYNKKNMFIPRLKNRLDTEIFKKNPEVRNPYEIVSYEKYLTMAIMYIMEDTQFMNKNYIEKECRPHMPGFFETSIRTDKDILLEIKKHNAKKRAEKEKRASTPNKETRTNKTNKATTSPVNKIKKTSAKKNAIKPVKKLKSR